MVFGGTAYPCVYKNGTYGSLARADAYLLKDGPSRHLLDEFRRAVPRTNWLRSARAKWRSPWPVTSSQAFYFQYSANSPKTAQPAGRSRPPSQPGQSGAAGGTAYLVNGLRAKDIADLLEISPKTVDTYRASLMRKLNVHDLVGLVKARYRAQPYDDFSASGSGRELASQPVLLFWYRSNAPIS